MVTIVVHLRRRRSHAIVQEAVDSLLNLDKLYELCSKLISPEKQY